MAGLRSTKTDAPFCWISRRALELIREQCDQENAVSSAIAVYVALAEKASRQGAEEFSAPHGLLMSMSGLSRRTVQRRLQDLVECGLLEIETPARKMASTFRLLTPALMRLDDASMRHGRRQLTVALFPNKVPRTQKERGENGSPSSRFIEWSRELKDIKEELKSLSAPDLLEGPKQQRQKLVERRDELLVLLDRKV
jgi:hypothetical protein